MRSFENIMGKGGIADSRHFLLFSQCFLPFSPLPNDKFLDCFKLKAFADDKIYVAKTQKFSLGRLENIVGKGENAGDRHFLLFPQCF